MGNILSRGDAIAKAQDMANRLQCVVTVHEHVGLYGQPGGDIPARRHFRLTRGRTQLGDEYAVTAIVDPMREAGRG